MYYSCHPFLHTNGEPMPTRGGKCLSQRHTVALQRERGGLVIRGIEDTCWQNWTWSAPGVWALIPDSLSQTTCSFSMKGSALKAIALSLFQICACLKGFQDIVLTGHQGGTFPMQKASGLDDNTRTLSTCLHIPFSYWPQISVFGKDGWVASGWWVIRRLLPRSHEPRSLCSFHLHSNFIHRVPCRSFSRH